MEAENSITLTIDTSENVFIALGWQKWLWVFMNILTRSVNT